MKTRYKATLAAMALGLTVSLGLTSCDFDDDGWAPVPPQGWNSFYDSALTGVWELIQANSAPVTGYDVNYMEFDGRGYGMYYYYDKGYREEDRFAYFCQRSSLGASRYQINIQYQNRNPSTMSYWFTGDRLWMQWMVSGQTVSYVYQRVAYAPW